MKETKLIQQGDVLLFKLDVNEIDGKKLKPTSRGHVLAEGEVTGHAHRISDAMSELVEAEDGTLYLQVKEDGAEVEHEEHHKVKLDKGLYRVGRVVEVDPYEETIRQVAD